MRLRDLLVGSLCFAALVLTSSQTAQSQLEGSFDGYSRPFTPPLPELRKTLPPAARMDADAVRFQLEVYDNPGIVMVEFMSPTCLACNGAGRLLKEVSTHYGDKVKLVRLEASRNIGICDQFELKRVPSMILFKDGELVNKFPLLWQTKKEELCKIIDHELEMSRLAKQQEQPVNLPAIRLVE